MYRNNWSWLTVVELSINLCINKLFVRRPEMTFGSTKCREITRRHNAQHYLGQSEDCIFCILLTTRTCNVCRDLVSRVSRNTRRNFNPIVTTLIDSHLWESSPHSIAGSPRLLQFRRLSWSQTWHPWGKNWHKRSRTFYAYIS